MTIQLSYKMNHVNESVTVKVLSPFNKGETMPYVKNHQYFFRNISIKRRLNIWIEEDKAS